MMDAAINVAKNNSNTTASAISARLSLSSNTMVNAISVLREATIMMANATSAKKDCSGMTTNVISVKEISMNIKDNAIDVLLSVLSGKENAMNAKKTTSMTQSVTLVRRTSMNVRANAIQNAPPIFLTITKARIRNVISVLMTNMRLKENAVTALKIQFGTKRNRSV